MNLIANNSRFLIRPGWHRPNIGSRVLSLTERRVADTVRSSVVFAGDFCRPGALPRRHVACIDQAANWMELGLTQGYRRTREGYSGRVDAAPKRVFVRPLCRDARAELTHPDRDRLQLTGAPKIMLKAKQMRKLPQCFKTIPDQRRGQGRRHRLPVVLVLGIAAGATLCGAVGILKSFQKSGQSIAEMVRKLTFRTRRVFDYLRMTHNSSARGFAR